MSSPQYQLNIPMMNGLEYPECFDYCLTDIYELEISHFC